MMTLMVTPLVTTECTQFVSTSLKRIKAAVKKVLEEDYHNVRFRKGSGQVIGYYEVTEYEDYDKDFEDELICPAFIYTFNKKIIV